MNRAIRPHKPWTSWEGSPQHGQRPGPPAAGRPPAEALAEEAAALHRIPDAPFTAALGTTRTVSRDASISVGGVRYSVPHTLIDAEVWVRFHGDDLVVAHRRDGGVTEVARHQRSTKGHPRIDPAHYPERSTIPGRTPRPATEQERAFLAIGEGAAATAGRFGDRDLGAIIDHLQHHPTIDGLPAPGQDASLQNGLEGWRVMGR